MNAMASQITSLTSVYSIVYSGADQRKHQSSASLAFVWGIHRWPVNSTHKGPVTRKMFPFDDVIMLTNLSALWSQESPCQLTEYPFIVFWFRLIFKGETAYPITNNAISRKGIWNVRRGHSKQYFVFIVTSSYHNYFTITFDNLALLSQPNFAIQSIADGGAFLPTYALTPMTLWLRFCNGWMITPIVLWGRKLFIHQTQCWFHQSLLVNKSGHVKTTVLRNYREWSKWNYMLEWHYRQDLISHALKRFDMDAPLKLLY